MNTNAGSKEVEGLLNRYDKLCTMWTSLCESSIALFNGHMIAHSFIIVACATLLTARGPLPSVALVFVSAAGAFLTVMLSATWARHTARTRLLEWYLEQLEADAVSEASQREGQGVQFFLTMLKLERGECQVRRHPKNDGIQPCFNPNYATWKSGRTRSVRIVPHVLSIVYAMFLSLAIFRLRKVVPVCPVVVGVIALALSGVCCWLCCRASCRMYREKP